jgi:hypothetical protein
MTSLGDKWVGRFALAALAALAAGAVVLLLADDDEASDQSPAAHQTRAATGAANDGEERGGRTRPADSRDPEQPASERERSRLEEAIGPSRRPRGAAERGAVRAAEAYVDALDRRDGQAACRLLAPGALEELALPRITKGGCAGSLESSIGYRDPRGSPVWEGATVEAIQSTSVDGDTATVVATVVTRFADRPEPSVEDDVVYLVRAHGRWLVAKPSATLYRAVGYPDVPPSALTPP